MNEQERNTLQQWLFTIVTFYQIIVNFFLSSDTNKYKLFHLPILLVFKSWAMAETAFQEALAKFIIKQIYNAFKTECF